MMRFNYIIPVILGFLVFFTILDSSTEIWNENSPLHLYIDIAALLLAGIIALCFYRNRPPAPDDVKSVHNFIHKALSLLIIIWGAVITMLDYKASGGYVVFVICLFLSGGLLLLEVRYLLTFGIAGIGILHFREGAVADAMQNGLPARDIIIVCMVLALTILLYQINRNALIRSFLLEWNLEEKVEKRTRELAEETEKAKKSDMLKTVFLANMSHEIRTPLNGILGFSNLLRDEKLDPETRKKYIDTVLVSGNTLLEILNEIIEVSRIESGACELFHEEFCLNDMITEVVDSFQGNPKVSSGKLMLVNQSENDEPVIMISDRLKLVQILINLVNNALKYTDTGIITVGVKTLEGDRLEIFVQDTGRGISSNDLQLIFSRFRQVELNPYNRGEGVGLGLTIVKGYADLLNADIIAESDPGKGSTFRVVMPVNYYAEK